MGERKRKGNKATPVYNIESINLEIDYEKLAKAIAKANAETNKSAAKMIEQGKSPRRTSFWRAVWTIITNRYDTNGQWVSSAFSYILYVFFRLIAIVGAFFAIGLPAYGFINLQWVGFQSIITIAYVVIISVSVLLLTLILWGMANEIANERDRNYILGVFSCIVSLAALIVALVALFKE